MNPQERDQLTLFLNQLKEVGSVVKDAEADRLIRETVAKQPDAAYLLVQRAMLVEQALNVAKSKIAELQSGQAGGRNSGFLGGGNPWAQSLGGSSDGVPGAGSYQIPRSAPAPLPSNSWLSGGGGSFLGNVASTAAGVVAGDFLFQGIENLLGHHSSSPSIWGDANHEPVEQTIINNYYDSPNDNGLAGNDDWPFSNDSGNFLSDDDDQDSGDDSSWV